MSQGHEDLIDLTYINNLGTYINTFANASDFFCFLQQPPAQKFC